MACLGSWLVSATLLKLISKGSIVDLKVKDKKLYAFENKTLEMEYKILAVK